MSQSRARALGAASSSCCCAPLGALSHSGAGESALDAKTVLASLCLGGGFVGTTQASLRKVGAQGNERRWIALRTLIRTIKRTFAAAAAAY